MLHVGSGTKFSAFLFFVASKEEILRVEQKI